MSIVTETKKRHHTGIGTSPLNMPFPLDFETPERRQYRQNMEEHKKKFTANDIKAYRPYTYGVQSHIIWPNAIMKGYLIKHIPPTFSFSKNKKKRFVILADRYIYTFKTDTPTAKYRDCLELGPESQAFVTDHLAGVLYCIEIRKSAHDQHPWFLQAEDADSMKIWLDRFRKTIQYINQYRDGKKDVDGPITKEKLQLIHTEEEVLFGTTSSICSSSDNSVHSTPRSSQHDCMDISSSSSSSSASLKQHQHQQWRNSDSTYLTDPPHTASTFSSSSSITNHHHHSFISPPLSPVHGSFSTTHPVLQRNDSMRSSLSHDDYCSSPRKSYSRLPDNLPPALPAPTSVLPPPPTM
ncbi:hypothetical protein BJ944DRAFT_273955 [Cunninghamella echinulata]|nr:hypothetical protein BJ944DRAFT_273955 [Cunninghamella echinulata]